MTYEPHHRGLGEYRVPRSTNRHEGRPEDASGWGRWGEGDQRGAANLIDEGRRRRAAALVTEGIVVSLARPIATATIEVLGGELRTRTVERSERGATLEHLGVACHGLSLTHLDALCHIWGVNSMWNGRTPSECLSEHGTRWGDVSQWASEGFLTRGVLLDVPGFRRTSYVQLGEPVTAEELHAVAKAQGCQPEPGDALVIYCGRERFDANSALPWGLSPDAPNASLPTGQEHRPGLDRSAVDYFRETDCSLLVWDMLDALPGRDDEPWPVHRALYLLGLGLVDNADLGALSALCRRLRRYDFLLSVAPLPIEGATGCLVNPLACL